MNPNEQQPNQQPESTPQQPSALPPEPVAPVVPTPDQAPAGTETSQPFASQPTADPVVQPAPVAPEVQPVPVAPVAPADSASPFGTQPTQAPAPAPNNKKKLFMIAGIVGGAVVLAVIGVILFLVMTTVSKQDYAAAATQFKEVNRASSSLTNGVAGYSSNTSDSEAEFNEAAKKVEESIATLKTENDELAKLKAVRVGEGKKLYDAFNTKLEAYLAYGDEVLTSVKNLRPALLTCAETGGSDTAARVAAYRSCADALGQVGDIPNAEFKTYIDAIKVAYEELATATEAMGAITSPFGAQRAEYTELRDKLYDIQENLLTATTTFSEALEKRDDEVSVKDTADALGNYLTEQQRK